MHEAVFQALENAWLVMAAMACPLLFMLTGSYGRHTSAGFGPRLPARGAVIGVHLPPVVLMGAACWAAPVTPPPAALWLGGTWMVFYGALLLCRLQAQSRPVPLSSVAVGMAFQSFNTLMNACSLTGAPTVGLYGSLRAPDWLLQPHLWLGAALFVPGLLIMVQSDLILLRLRRMRGLPSSGRIPQGGLFRLISCPNYSGEMLAITGWAVACGSWAGFASALWTAALLMPKAHAHHRWYLRNFADYPRNRRALLPGIF